MLNSTYDRRELAKFLQDNANHLIEAWKTQAKAHLVAARAQTEPALTNSLPLFILALARMFDPQSSTDSACEEGVCETHGAERAALPLYDLEATMREYSLLRRVLLDALEAEFVLMKSDRDALLVNIDEAVQKAAEAFVRGRGDSDRLRLLIAEGRINEMENESGQRDTFVSFLSHDLRGPLGAVKLALEVLLQGVAPTPAVNEMADVMTRNLKQAETLISDLLDVNHLKSGTPIPLRPVAFDMFAVVSQIVEDLSVVHGERFIVTGEGPVNGRWSLKHIVRVLENLVSNALKYGEENGDIEVSVRVVDAEVRIAVNNKGQAIPLADLPTLFDAYYRSRSAISGHAGGWGLGLTLVKGVAEAHGGHVTVESDVAHGTTFTVILPLGSHQRK